MYRVKLPVHEGLTPFSGERYGMIFSNGVGETDVEFVAEKLKNKKGYEVEKLEDKKPKKEK